MARSLPYTISNGDDFDADPVQGNFDNLNDRFATDSNGIANADISTTAAIDATKLAWGGTALSTILGAEHEADGTHTFTSNRVRGLYLTPDATTPESKITITAAVVELTNSAGSTSQITSVSETVNTTGSAKTAGGFLTATTEANSEEYVIILLEDSTQSSQTECAVLYPTDNALWSATFITDLAAFNANQSGGVEYDYAGIVGYVYNDSDGNLEVPRAIGGGTVGDQYSPTYTLMATGSYSISGDKEVTGVGFLADEIWVHQGNSSSSVVWVTGMGTYSKTLGASPAFNTTGIKSVTYDGFTVDTSFNTNTNYWVAYKKHTPTTITQ